MEVLPLTYSTSSVILLISHECAHIAQGGYPRVIRLGEEGACWKSGRIFVGDFLERAAGVDLHSATPSDVEKVDSHQLESSS